MYSREVFPLFFFELQLKKNVSPLRHKEGMLSMHERDYVSYAVSVAGRRILTLLDVATDMRTFFILWNDPNTVVIACFLLASISAPLLVYWASSHNFNEAIMAHKTFGERRPRNCRERCHRNFYNAVAVPLVGCT